jgi:dolichol kinase
VNRLPSTSITDFEVRRELERKSLHLPGLFVPFLYQQAPFITIFGLTLISVLYYFSEVRRISKGTPLPIIGYLTDKLTRSAHLDLAPIYLAVGIGFAAMAFPFKAALAGAFLVCLCDGLAAVVGMKFGKHRIMFIKKTYLGTLAFFLAAVLSLFPLLGWQGTLITASVATLIEAMSIEGIDNLFLPILGGLLAQQFL